MAYLHSLGIVHRDLKPENIFLTSSAVVRIGDFGISSSGQNLVTESTLSAIGGTLEYMAPEVYAHVVNQSTSGCDATPAVDIYAFAIIFWECLAENGSSVSDLPQLLRVRRRANNSQTRVSLSDIRHLWTWPSLDSIPATCPSKCRALLQQCWCFEPAQRLSFAKIQVLLHSTLVAAGSLGEESANVPPRAGNDQQRFQSRAHLSHTTDSRLPFSNDVYSTFDQPLLEPRSVNRTDKNASSFEMATSPDIGHRGPLKCLARVWASCGLHFRSEAAEANYLKFRMRGAYGMAMKVSYTTMALFLGSVLAVNVTRWDAAASSATAQLCAACLMWAWAAAAAWNRRWRGCAARLLWPVTWVWAACTVWAAVDPPTAVDMSFNNFTVTSDYTVAVAPFNASFVNGTYTSDLAIPAADICAGRVTEPLHGTEVVTACSTMAFQEEMGAFLYVSEQGMFFFNMLTVPGSLMALGLPLREYVVTLTMLVVAVTVRLFYLFMGTVAQNGFVAGASDSAVVRVGTWGAALLSVDTIVVVACCFASVLSHERSQRSLFVLYCGLQSERIVLERNASTRRYRAAITQNRNLFVRSHNPMETTRNTTVRQHVTKAVTFG